MICNDYIDTNTSSYSSECAAQMLNMSHQDYSFTMAILGGLVGLVFLSSIIYILFKIGKSYRT